MKSLEEQRTRYVAAQQAVRDQAVHTTVVDLERHVAKLDVQKCRDAYARNYVETGAFYGPAECYTPSQPCLDYKLVEREMERRNPHVKLLRHDSDWDMRDRCYAQLRPEPLFEKEGAL